MAETANVRHAELPNAGAIFGSTPGMRAIRTQVELALQDDAPVLILGESGTGKQVIGRFLHTQSARQNGPFVKVKCGTLPVDLLEAEIFGKQTDTAEGARKNASMEIGADGTLFLNEICEMDLSLQQKLSRLLKTVNEGIHIQGSEPARANVRFVCTSSFDGGIGSEACEVSSELLQCFAHRIHLLPLRERKQDIPQLCDFLLEKLAREFGRPVPRLSPYALRALQQWKWPGNIRELENWIARIVIFGTEEAIGLDFNRQLIAWGEELPRRHRAVHASMVRGRRFRRRS
jgi:DNA-binding NtrC family response regulator